eukprot:16451393-Heterocapsa_arctica.AAC.1
MATCRPSSASCSSRCIDEVAPTACSARRIGDAVVRPGIDTRSPPGSVGSLPASALPPRRLPVPPPALLSQQVVAAIALDVVHVLLLADLVSAFAVARRARLSNAMSIISTMSTASPPSAPSLAHRGRCRLPRK